MMNFFLQQFEDVRWLAFQAGRRASVMRCVCLRFIDVFTVFPRTLGIKKQP
jgi:hypothetical protein